MSFIVFGNLPSSVPKVKDTTPCMEAMLDYEDCIGDFNIRHAELVHPNWPTIFPRLLTDGKLKEPIQSTSPTGKEFDLLEQYPLTKKEKQYLWECEQERFVFKACLRKVIGLQRTKKHTSWDTANVANLQLA
jgi:hypothetical protein